MLTEQKNPNTLNIDQLSTAEIAGRIHAEDRTVLDAIERAMPQIVAAIDAIYERMRAGGRLFYVGAGTSGRLGILDAVELVPTFSSPPELVQGILAGGLDAVTQSIEGVEDDRQAGIDELKMRSLTAGDVVLGIAASGRTPFVLGALDYAQSVGARTIAIACNQPAAVLDAAEIAIPLVTGPEVVTGSTRMKAGTAQKMTLNLMSTAVMIKLGKVYGNLMVDVQVKNAKLRERAERIVSEIGRVNIPRAAALLDESGNEVKTAIVIARRGVSADAARALLHAAGGVLRPVID
ncbi:MAG: N-acetylmuramic acid 6-phosphate etherase [Anaerolineae bacterium]|nr:N-acetylmuramic acid 6-phosphate etherase [Anaerolineae bacterium]